ncbi:MAG: NAD(P)H-dependent oxidoreductase subunit E [Chloroflexota bacterium]
MKSRTPPPSYAQARTKAVCPMCGQPSRTRETVCGGPPIALLCNDCRRESLPKGKLSVQFCVGGCCTREGAREALDALLESLNEQHAVGPVSVVPVDCMDMCEDGPVCRVLPDRKTARRVSPAWAARLGKDLARDRRARKK